MDRIRIWLEHVFWCCIFGLTNKSAINKWYIWAFCKFGNVCWSPFESWEELRGSCFDLGSQGFVDPCLKAGDQGFVVMVVAASWCNLISIFSILYLICVAMGGTWSYKSSDLGSKKLGTDAASRTCTDRWSYESSYLDSKTTKNWCYIKNVYHLVLYFSRNMIIKIFNSAIVILVAFVCQYKVVVLVQLCRWLFCRLVTA